jgi:hypothetical protein
MKPALSGTTRLEFSEKLHHATPRGKSSQGFFEPRFNGM